jgi:hypothetical protein
MACQTLLSSNPGEKFVIKSIGEFGSRTRAKVSRDGPGEKPFQNLNILSIVILNAVDLPPPWQ